MRCKNIIFSIIGAWLPYSAVAQLDVDWLLGISGGYMVQRARLTSTLNYTHVALPPGFFQTHFRNNLHDGSAMGGVLGGVQFACNRWFLGLELAADMYDLDRTHGFAKADRFGVRGWGGEAAYDKGNSMSASLRWGYKVTQTVWPYIRLGAETSKDELHVRFAGDPIYPAGQYQTTDKHHMWRYLVGFGAESVVPKICALKLRLEYNYLSRGERLFSRGLIIDNLTNPYFDSETLARFHQWKLALVWYFG